MPEPDITFLQRLIHASRWTARWVVRWTGWLLRRIGIALLVFLRALWDAEFARAFHRGATLARQPGPPVSLDQAPPDGALLLLGLLQKEARLLDFLGQNVGAFSDQEVGAAARVVHQGCRRVLDEYLTITPVRPEPEGGPVTLKPGFDPTSVRLTGQVVGEPPFRGILIHPGWRAAEVHLPRVASGHDLRILAPAEVEL